jgi:hypothetical protein
MTKNGKKSTAEKKIYQPFFLEELAATLHSLVGSGVRHGRGGCCLAQINE